MRIIDLTKIIESGMEIYPGDPEVKITQVHHYNKEGWILSHWSFGSHTGTHVDSLSHMDPSGESLDQLPLEKFIGKAKVVTMDENFPSHTGLVFREGVISLSDIDKIKKAAPKFLVIGDNACFSEVEVEKKLLQNKILTFTNLINLNLLPNDKIFMFYGVPLKVKGADGSPIRAFAILED